MYSFLRQLVAMSEAKCVGAVRYTTTTGRVDVLAEAPLPACDDGRARASMECVRPGLEDVLGVESRWQRPYLWDMVPRSGPRGEDEEEASVLIGRTGVSWPWVADKQGGPPGVYNYLVFVDSDILVPRGRNTEDESERSTEYVQDFMYGDYVKEFVTAARLWFDWASEHQAGVRALLKDGDSTHEAFMEQLSSKHVLPIAVDEFAEFLSGYCSASAASRVSMPARIDGLAKITETFCPSGECGCFGASGGRVGDEDGCPRLCHATVDRLPRLHVLGRLATWETRFWENNRSTHWATDEWRAWRKQGLEALKEAVQFLYADVDFAAANNWTLLRAFTAYAIERLIVDDEHISAWTQGEPHASTLECPAKLAVLARMLLTSPKWTVETIEALTTVLAEYGYRVLKIPRRLDIVSHLRQSMRSEPALHVLKPYYRDHFFHAIEVCLLGHALLLSHVRQRSVPDPDDELVAHLADKRRTSRIALLRQWWVAALLHDTGYGVETLKGALTLMDFFAAHPAVDSFTSGVRHGVSKLGTAFNSYPDLEDETGRGHDHGVVMAHYLNTVIAKLGAVYSDDYTLAARAIAFHNSRLPAVDGKSDPLAALLIVCDSLQEWRRAHLGFGRASATILTRIMGAGEAPGGETFGPVDTFGFGISPRTNPARSAAGFCWDSDSVLTVDLTYADSINENSGVFFLWLDATYNLQRVDLTELDLDVQIRYRTPKPKGRRRQYDRLQDCVREVPILFMDRWLDLARNGQPGSAVWYDYDEPSQTETLTLSVKELNVENRREPVLGGTIGDFYEALREWPGYFDDRNSTEDSGVRRVI